MTKDMLNQLKDFEIFVEKLEIFIEDIKETELENGKYQLKEFDLRNDAGDIFPIPTKLEDYFEIWEIVKKHHNDFKQSLNFQEHMPNETFLDVYWNDVDANMAHYVGHAFWAYFDEEFGVFYDDSKDVVEKINIRKIYNIIKEEGEIGANKDELYVDNYDGIIYNGMELAQIIIFADEKNKLWCYFLTDEDNGCFVDFETLDEETKNKIIKLEYFQ